MDTIFIENLHVDTIIGIYDWEKEQLQPLYLDLKMTWDIQNAARTDSFVETLCYDIVAKAVSQMLKKEPINLIETVAERVANLLLEDFHIKGVEVTVRKPTALEHARAAGVHIKRGTW